MGERSRPTTTALLAFSQFTDFTSGFEEDHPFPTLVMHGDRRSDRSLCRCGPAQSAKLVKNGTLKSL